MKANLACIFVAALSTVVMWTAQASAVTTTEYTWDKIKFQTLLPFSDPQKIGLEAVVLVHPPDSNPGEEQMEITLVRVSQVLQESLENNDAEVLAYVKTTFFGISEPASLSLKRFILGNELVGESQDINFPRDADLEYYLVPLSDGDKIFMAFKWGLDFPREQVEAVIDTVTKSFKETE